MRMTNSQLKLAARQCLQGKYGGSVLMLFLLYALSIAMQIPYQIISMLSSVFMETPLWGIGISFFIIMFVYSILMTLVSGTLGSGVAWYFYQMVSGGTYETKDIFFYFRNGFLQFLKLYGLFLLIAWIPYIAVALIGAGCGVGVYLEVMSPAAALIIISIAIMAASLAAVLISLNYAFIFYLYGENRDLKAMEILKESRRLMKGNKMRLFWLGFSFIGILLLGMMSLGIGYLWIVPYLSCTSARFYLDVKEEKSPAGNEMIS